jgi:hypothetical protein
MSQEFKTGGSSGFVTGTICSDTNLYKCTDGKVEYIEHIGSGDSFPPFPGGTGKSKATWYKVTKATDGDRNSFTAVKVAAV